MKYVRRLLPLAALTIPALCAYPVSSSLKTSASKPQSVNLVLGNPSDATTDVNNEDYFLMVNLSLSYRVCNAEAQGFLLH